MPVALFFHGYPESGEPFGRERLKQTLEKSKTNPLQVLPELLMQEITAHCGSARQRDDITMLAVEL